MSHRLPSIDVIDVHAPRQDVALVPGTAAVEFAAGVDDAAVAGTKPRYLKGYVLPSTLFFSIKAFVRKHVPDFS